MANLKDSAFKSALDFPARPLELARVIIAGQKQLLSLVRSALPVDLGEHVQYCVHSGKQVLIYTEAASWASQIRFYSEVILNKISASGQLNIVSLQIKILQQISTKTRTPSARIPSRQNIKLLCEQSDPNHKPDVLQQALSRLANTLERRSSKRSDQ